MIMAEVRFESTIQKFQSHFVIQIPESAGKKLPSRGMVMISGTINGIYFETELEPDGRGSHWFKPEDALLQKLSVSPEEPLFFIVEPMKTWPEPKVPEDLQAALSSSKMSGLFNSITPRAQWEWIRWIRFTNNPETRARRIEVTLSKLSEGKKRPCCFDLSRCTDMRVCKSGVLSVK
jgi:hypothetical protein